MKTNAAFLRSRAALVVGALVVTVLAGGCITHPPGGSQKVQDNSKETRVKHRKAITHPPGGENDYKDTSVSAPAPGVGITHPGGHSGQ